MQVKARERREGEGRGQGGGGGGYGKLSEWKCVTLGLWGNVICWHVSKVALSYKAFNSSMLCL